MESRGLDRTAAARLPSEARLPPVVWRHYRHTAWVVHEQRLLVLALGFVLAACALVWSLAWHLGRKPAVVVRAGPSLKEAAAAFTGVPEISFDQMAFFLHGCLPLLYAADPDGHRWLPLAQGLVAPDVYGAAERRLAASGPAIREHGMTQSLTVTDVEDVVADGPSRRAGATVRGFLTVTTRDSAARFFPWRAQALLEVNPVSRLSPWPFYLLRLEQSAGPAAEAADPAQKSAGEPKSR
jgi:hypothetical protein